MVMSLEEAKKQVEAEDAAKVAAEAAEQKTTEEAAEEALETNSDDQNPQDRDEENPEETEAQNAGDSETLEPWQETGEQTDGVMPVSAHVKAKHKLRAKLTEKDDEIDRLKKENEELKKAHAIPENFERSERPKRPRAIDFETDEAYEDALDKYEDEITRLRVLEITTQEKTKASQQALKQNLDDAVNAHYERADKLVTEKRIKPEVYQAAELKVKQTLETLRPGEGELIFNQLAQILGKGSEKVLYYAGNNQKALDKVSSLLAADKSGMRLVAYLSEEKARLNETSSTTPRSNAPAPSADANGDMVIDKNERLLKADYDKAIKAGNMQKAFNIRKKARDAKIAVSSW